MAARKVTTGASRRISLSASAQRTAPLATTMAAAGIAATVSGSPRGRSTAKPSTTNSSRMEMISAATISDRYGGARSGPPFLARAIARGPGGGDQPLWRSCRLTTRLGQPAIGVRRGNYRAAQCGRFSVSRLDQVAGRGARR
jgi:hypothetical protein